jgi:glycosyltransferase involved in cell wall biosynthesis
MSKIGFVISKAGTAGSAGVNRMIFNSLKDELKISAIHPETLYYHTLPIVGIMLNYFTLYEKRRDFDYIIATTYAGLPFVENNHLIEIFHGVDTAMILTISKEINKGLLKEKIFNKWFDKTKNLFTETLEDLKPMEAVNKIIENHCAQKAEHIIAVSEKVKEDLIDIFNINSEKITVIINGIPDYWFIDNGDFSDFGVVCPTRLDYRVFTFLIKGQDRMLEILSQLPTIPKYIYANFSKAVPEDFQEKIIKIITEFPKTKFIKDIQGEELKKNYKPGYVLLSTSRTEACQLTLLEGMASRLIPVTYCVGVVKDVIRHGENGYIVHNEGEAIKVIKFLEKNPLIRQKIANNAYQTAKKLFTYDKMISEYRQAFKKILK